MTVPEVFGKAFDMLTGIGTGLLTLLGKGKLDETEIAKAKLETERFLANLDILQKQMTLWLQQSLIDLEKATGARWRAPLILVSGGALVAVCVNNVLAACYIPAARPVMMNDPAVLTLAGMFLLLVTGDAMLLLRALGEQKRRQEPQKKKE